MKTLYFDCGMGAAGDMLCASLLDTLPNPEAFVAEFNALGLPLVRMEREKIETCGISSCHVRIFVGQQEEQSLDASATCHEHNRPEQSHEHSHRGYAAVEAIVGKLAISPKVRENVLAVYRLITEAEAKVHNKAVDLVHFHELGNMDAIADVLAFSLLMEKIAPDAVCASPIRVGSGHIHCAHGILPVPAPATAELLLGIPCYGGEIQAELCTPTGAALLRRFVGSFGPQPMMSVSAIGYGAGTKVFPKANCIRAFIGEADDKNQLVDEISCNLDDITGEAIGFAMERLFENGALDVFTEPIGMKKSRPGIKLCCICMQADTPKLAELILRHTTTLGIRIAENRRITKERSTETLQTSYGPVRVKHSPDGSKPEYEDLAKIAREQNMTLTQVTALLETK